MGVQAWYAVAFLLAFLVCIPLLIKWFKLGLNMRGGVALNQSKLVSAIAVGPQQKVVTLEVGPDGARVLLVVGVTAQQITCLHVIQANELSAAGEMIEK